MTAHSRPRPESSTVGLPASVRALRTGGTAPRLRLVCFPYAGRGAYLYRTWGDQLPHDVDLLELPGREDRIREEPFRSLDDTVTTVSKDLVTVLDGPFAIFGHSLGAIIGAEVALQLEHERGLRPEHVFVSGCTGLPAIDPNRRPIHDLPDNELLDHVRRLNGTREELLAHKALRALVLRLIRVDYAMFHSYTYTEHRTLSCPVTVFGGDADPTTTPATLAAWSAVTTGPTDVHVLPGDHFFLHSARDELLLLLSEALAR
jgi:medium-chain acyl-[acyl-carrier-protein] hydrolase